MKLNEFLTLDRPIVSIDFETTGTNPQTDRILQIGVAKLYPNGEYKEWQSLINPTVSIPKDAMESHHITEAMVRDAPTFKFLHLKIAKALEGCDLLGYNIINFDAPLLQTEFSRCGYKWEFPRIIDGFRLWQRYYPRNLTAFIEAFALETEADEAEYKNFTAHDAAHDARWTLRGATGFFKVCADAPHSVQALHDMFLVTPRDSGSLDPDGKLKWNENNEACIGFGKKHAGRSLQLVMTVDKGYLEWMLTGNFSPVVKQIVSDALHGKFPVR